MSQIPILNGVFTDQNADFRTSYPVNLIPVPKDTGISKGYLRAAPGITQLATGPGTDRGGIFVANGCYRVMGGQVVLVAADGTVTALTGATIAGSGPVSMDYSTDRLCIVGGGKAYYAAAGVVTEITSPNLGVPIAVRWVDGYFMFTDGTFIYTTNLSDPYTIDPTKYAASDIDPDSVTTLLKYRNEMFVFNRFTTEVFDNVGGSGFPFARLPGGIIPRGAIGTNAACLFAETMAWVGSARNEAPSVWVANGSTSVKIATREVEIRLAAYTEEQLSAGVYVEAKADRMHQHLYVHLPNETMVYDAAASAVVGEPVWFFMSTGVSGINPYRARGFVYGYGKWIVGDTIDGRIGFIDETVSTQYGEVAGWQFDTLLVYNGGKGAVVHDLELVCTAGRAPEGDTPTAFTSYTLDGIQWSEERQAKMGVRGATLNRLTWRRQGYMQNIRGQRFRGANKTPISFARLEAQLEGLYA